MKEIDTKESYLKKADGQKSIKQQKVDQNQNTITKLFKQTTDPEIKRNLSKNPFENQAVKNFKIH